MDNLITVSGWFPNLKIKDYGGWSNRNKLTIDLLKLMFAKYRRKFLNKRVKFSIYTGDQPEGALEYNHLGPTFAFSTTKDLKDKIIPIPDYIFIAWPEVGIESWEEIVNQCDKKSNLPYEKTECFWIGNSKTHKTREQLINLSNKHPELLLAIDMNWNAENGVEVINGVTATKYVSIPDHAQYKYLIDVQGVGWSGRLKLLMHLGRPIFIVERPYEEFFFPFLEPYKHYIPVKEDLSDLIEQIEWLNSHPNTYDFIAKETKSFAEQYLNKDYAIEQLFKVVYQYGTQFRRKRYNNTTKKSNLKIKKKLLHQKKLLKSLKQEKRKKINIRKRGGNR